MSGRSYCHYEIIRWGYVALVCIALAFTSMTGATASTKSSDNGSQISDTSKRGACLANTGTGEVAEQSMCTTPERSLKERTIKSAFGFAMVNVSSDPSRGGPAYLGPLQQ